MNFINYGQHYIDKEDLSYIKKSLFSDKITQGKYVELFEKKLSKRYGSKYCASVNSGTSALILAIKALNLPKNSKVISPAITFFASASSTIINQHKLDLIDIELDSYTIDLNKLEAKLKKDKNIKAVIGVDYAGNLCSWKDLNFLKKKYNFFLINDNCHALGSKLNGSKEYAVKFSDIVTQSFHPVKHFTTGEGGAILTNNSNINNRVKLLRNHGIVRNLELNRRKGNWYYHINEIGYNFRMSDLNCALGVAQIKKLNKFVSRRRQIANFYNNFFQKYKNINIPFVKKHIYHSYHIYPLLIDFQKFKITKKEFFLKMYKRKINLKVNYIPLYRHPVLKKYNFNKKNFFNSEKFYNQEISLPIYYSLKEKNLDYITDNIKDILKLS